MTNPVVQIDILSLAILFPFQHLSCSIQCRNCPLKHSVKPRARSKTRTNGLVIGEKVTSITGWIPSHDLVGDVTCAERPSRGFGFYGCEGDGPDVTIDVGDE